MVDGEEVLRVDPGPSGFWNFGGFDQRQGYDNPWQGASRMAPFDQEVRSVRVCLCVTVCVSRARTCVVCQYDDAHAYADAHCACVVCVIEVSRVASWA